MGRGMGQGAGQGTGMGGQIDQDAAPAQEVDVTPVPQEDDLADLRERLAWHEAELARIKARLDEKTQKD